MRMRNSYMTGSQERLTFESHCLKKLITLGRIDKKAQCFDILKANSLRFQKNIGYWGLEPKVFAEFQAKYQNFRQKWLFFLQFFSHLLILIEILPISPDIFAAKVLLLHSTSKQLSIKPQIKRICLKLTDLCLIRPRAYFQLEFPDFAFFLLMSLFCKHKTRFYGN